ncbi:MAG: hypothetical protein NC200_01030 [Candidatus Gastranaerophilales bacterium]|nr:hypothetical protein [Candidatus Gastranaerophilales bacterium]
MIIIPNKNLEIIEILYEKCNVIDFIEVKSQKSFFVKRVYLRNNTPIKPIFDLFNNKTTSNNLVKKSVRVDNDIYHALREVAHNDKTFITKKINSAVMNKISTGEIDLIKAKWFSHKITVYFTNGEYRRVEKVIKKLKDIKIKGITFSSIVRSILYESLGLVQEVKNLEPNSALRKDVA